MNDHAPLPFPGPVFHQKRPALLVVDDFYRDPEIVRGLAEAATYAADLRYFKGLRSTRGCLLPYVKEEFERLLGAPIVDWMDQPANGVFQKTTGEDPLVWHSDLQNYAAAIYLTKPHEGPENVTQGTSFWRHRTTLARRPPASELECNETYSEFNLTHPDNWELVDQVGSVFNRLVLWDAQLIHSATSYAGCSVESPRLVQLFFFNVKPA